MVSLTNAKVADLSPIAHMSLQELDLTQVTFNNVEVLDQYLTDIVENYANRRACTVKLTTEPGEKGMQAINTIINEPAWNEAGAWKFVINDKIYTHNE